MTNPTEPDVFALWSLLDPTRDSARLAVVGYGVAVALLLVQGPTRRARLAWTLTYVVYVLHVIAAFHYHHHWSHDRAVQHVEAGSGFGGGIYFSHLFTLVWTVDVVWWWLWPERYAARPLWIGSLVHGYLAFLTFNATVVFGPPVSRIGGIVLFVLLAVLFLRPRKEPAP
jgi:hypothetical protein